MTTPNTADVIADTEADIAVINLLNVVAASVTGEKHLRRQQINQDSMFVGSRRDGVLCLIAADGAGSARAAQQGSSLAVEVAANIIAEATLPTASPTAISPTCEDAWRQLLLDWLERVHTQMTTWLHDHNKQCQPEDSYTLQDLSTTLLIAVVTPSHLAAAQVGDGGIVAVDKAGQPCFVTKPYHGEYVGETVFITSEAYSDYASVKVLARDTLCGLAVMTDGLEAVAIQQTQQHDQQKCQHQNVPFSAFFNPLFVFTANPAHNAATKSQQLAEFLTNDRLSARSDDDKTLILTSWSN